MIYDTPRPKKLLAEGRKEGRKEKERRREAVRQEQNRTQPKPSTRVPTAG